MGAWFVKASVFHSVNSAPSANGGSNPAWECCIDHLNSKEFAGPRQVLEPKAPPARNGPNTGSLAPGEKRRANKKKSVHGIKNILGYNWQTGQNR